MQEVINLANPIGNGHNCTHLCHRARHLRRIFGTSLELHSQRCVLALGLLPLGQSCTSGTARKKKEKGGIYVTFIKNKADIFFLFAKKFSKSNVEILSSSLGYSKKSKLNLPCHRRDKPG